MHIFYKFYKTAGLLGLLLSFFATTTGWSATRGDYEQLLKQALAAKDHRKAALYCYELAGLYDAEGQKVRASDYLTQSLKWGGKADDPTILYLANQHMGRLLTEQGEHSKALSHHQKALKLAQQLGKAEWMLGGLVDVARSYMAMDRPKKALEPLEEALSLAIRHNDGAMQEKCYAWLAEAYRKSGNAAKAGKYQRLYESLAENEQHLKTLQERVVRAGAERTTATHRLEQQSQRLRQTSRRGSC